VRECVELALQAPTGGNDQGWHFVVVTDSGLRAAIAEVFRGAAVAYSQRERPRRPRRERSDQERTVRKKVLASSGYLFEHLQDVPVHVIPCVEGRPDGTPLADQATLFGSILPAVWSFMLAARSRGLGTAWTTLHLANEAEAAELLGIPEGFTQVALIPVAYFTGHDFKPAARPPVEDITYWDTWGATS
jgi:nitroreductase